MRNGQRVSIRGRRTRIGRVIAIGVSAFVLGAPPALAQVATMPEVKAGQNVWATRTDGVTIKGKVIAIAATGLQLQDVDRVTSLPIGDIYQIEERDPLKNGAVNGAGIGAIALGLGAYAGHAISCITSNSDRCNRSGKTMAVMGALAGAGIGALVGAGIDRAIESRRLLYYRSWPAAALTIAPVVSPHGAGAGASLRW
jgi:hypothetical protein